MQILLELAASQKRFPDVLDRRSRKLCSSLAHPFAAGWNRRSGRLLELMDAVLSHIVIAYIDDGTEEGVERWENIQELRQAAYELSELDLMTFLEHVALVSDQDTLSDQQNAPTLLTLHSAKGLEFPVVFIIGLDDGVLPHQRSFDDPEAMAEERRLFYVGVTRAKDRLSLLAPSGGDWPAPRA